MNTTHTAIPSEFLAATDGSFDLSKMPTSLEQSASKKALKNKLEDAVSDIAERQRMLYAHNKFSLLLVFQAMDAAGKDSTIRSVLSGVNPAGCHVTSFKRPSSTELDHDFLWRSACKLPERGRIGVFNRSYYEEVLVVRVHPGILDSQQLPYAPDLDTVWEQRLASIADHERHLADNGTVIVKFFLNVSRQAQRERFIDRLETPRKRWKFEPNDIRERGHWDKYMHAYEQAIRATSKPWAPWYSIPADDKPLMRYQVADIVRQTLDALPIRYPEVETEDQALFDTLLMQLKADD